MESNNNKIKLKGSIRLLTKMPLYVILVLAVVSGLLFVVKLKLGVIAAIVTAVYAIIVIYLYYRSKKNVLKNIVEFGAEYSQVQRKLIRELEIPYGIMNPEGDIMWTNEAFDNIERSSAETGNIRDIFKDFKDEYLKFEEDSARNECDLSTKNHCYKVIIKKFNIKDPVNASGLVSLTEEGSGLLSVYMFDTTENVRLKKESIEERIVTGHIYIDNYDEVLQSVESTRKTLLIALIDRKINRYFEQYDGVVRKLENDEYFVVFKAKYISKIQTDKFSVLDEVKTVNVGNGLPATISIGIGMGAKNLLDNYELSTSAVQMALGRGGDQAVLKDGNKIYYYGGKSKAVEKNTKVKARVIATAFRELIDTKDTIYIMGHQVGDNDAFGAAVGMYRICKTVGKEAKIVIGKVSESVNAIKDEFTDEQYSDMFISGPVATMEINKNDALIVVDCSRASYTEHPELVRRAQCIIVLDHHRQTSDVIDNAQLSYIELSASSACEMVVEIMQYINETVKLPKIEAEALLSGISVDTNNFTIRTGSRTFEAAAYLKRFGADVAKVRRMFRDDLNDYKAKAKAIETVEIFLNDFAIAMAPNSGIDSPTVVGAQVANELLNVKGVKASFVLTEYDNQVYISARSIDKVNVQIIMEQFGGGGHMNLAGAQVKESSIEDVKISLKKTIKKMKEEGDIQ